MSEKMAAHTAEVVAHRVKDFDSVDVYWLPAFKERQSLLDHLGQTDAPVMILLPKRATV